MLSLGLEVMPEHSISDEPEGFDDMVKNIYDFFSVYREKKYN